MNKQIIVVAALYKFSQLADFQEIKPRLLEFCVDHEIYGTLLLAEEGIRLEKLEQRINIRSCSSNSPIDTLFR